MAFDGLEPTILITCCIPPPPNECPHGNIIASSIRAPLYFQRRTSIKYRLVISMNKQDTNKISAYQTYVLVCLHNNRYTCKNIKFDFVILHHYILDLSLKGTKCTTQGPVINKLDKDFLHEGTIDVNR